MGATLDLGHLQRRPAEVVDDQCPRGIGVFALVETDAFLYGKKADISLVALKSQPFLFPLRGVDAAVDDAAAQLVLFQAAP